MKTAILILFSILICAVENLAQTAPNEKPNEKEVSTFYGAGRKKYLEPEMEFPAFNFTDIEGGKITRGNVSGKITLFYFWSSACEECKLEISSLNKLVEKYKSEGVLFMAVTADEKTLLENFLEKNSFLFEIASDAQDFIRANRIRQFPQTVLVNSKGIITTKFKVYEPGNIKEIDQQIQLAINRRNAEGNKQSED